MTDSGEPHAKGLARVARAVARRVRRLEASITDNFSFHPIISNREAEPEEAGYRPADAKQVAVNPPSLVWIHEAGAVSYSVQWSSSEEFSDAVEVREVPYNTYTHNRPLPPGRYFWRYRFKNCLGAQSNWSATRCFSVLPGTLEFPMPSRAEQAERVPREHPRLFLRPEDLPQLRDLAARDPEGIFRELRMDADKLLEAEPAPEPLRPSASSRKREVGLGWANRLRTLRVCLEAETLAFVYLMTGEQRYGEAARKWILHLARWDPDGATNFVLNDDAAMPLLHRVPRAYDWAYGVLSESERLLVRQVWARRGKDAYAVLRQRPHLGKPRKSHNNRTWHKLGEAAIAFLGEPDVPQAAEWLDYALNSFFAVYPAWSDEQGGWHPGLDYWAQYMAKVSWWFDAARSALKIDCFRKPFFARDACTFALYTGAPGTPHSGFGDHSHSPPSPEWRSFVEYFARSTGNGHWQWWIDQWTTESEPDYAAGCDRTSGSVGRHPTLAQTRIHRFLRSTLPSVRPAPPVERPPSRVFCGTGIASLHNTLLDSAEDVHFLFKSSPFGRQSHGHNPHNSFQLNAFSEALLTTTVFRDWDSSPFHDRWCHSTEAHNAVLVDRQGQSLTADPFGRIVDHQLTPETDYICGQAAEAYQGRLKRFRRHVVFSKPDLIVIYDDLEAAQPSTFQFLLHALGPFTVQPERARLNLERPRAGVTVQYCSPCALQLRQWDGYQPPPDVAFPNTWHVEASTIEKRTTLGMLTVLAPHKAGQALAWTAEREESESAVGVRVRLGSQTVTVAFRKVGCESAALDGRAFTAPFAVWR